MKNFRPDITLLLTLNTPYTFIIHLFLLFLMVFLISIHTHEENLNFWIRDLLASHSYEQNALNHSSDFTVIEIDDPSFNWLSTSYGSLRISIANILIALKKLNPRCIVVNFLFYGKGLNIEEICLTAAANSQIPIFFRAQLTEDGNYFTPLEAFSAKHPRFGFLHFPFKEDKTVRQIKIFADIENFGTQFDLSSQITAFLMNPVDPETFLDKSHKFLKFKNEDPDKTPQIKMDHSGNILIRFSHKKRNIQFIKAVDLINGTVQADQINNKIIIIDGTASVFQNNFKTPLGNLPESVILSNAISTEMNPDLQFEFIEKKIVLLIILLLIALFLILNIKGSFPLFLLLNASGITILIFSFKLFYDKGVILPYVSLLLTVILPGLYSLMIRHFNLSVQSHRLIKLASIDSLSELHTFRYFTYLLQRLFIRQKKKKQNLYLSALELYMKNTTESDSWNDISPGFFKKFGEIIRGFYGKKVIHGFSNDQNLCFLAFPNIIHETLMKNFEKIREKIIALIRIHQLPLQVRIICVEMEKSKVSSSFQMIQILQNMQRQKSNTERIIQEYTPSQLTLSFSDTKDANIPQTDLGYVSIHLAEDKKDLAIMKKQLNQSLREYSMAQKLSAMGQLSSYYAHELKNPLHNLLNCFEVLEDEAETEEEKKEVFQLMKSEIQRVVDLTNNMKSHFKPSDESPNEVNINHLISNTHSLLKRKFQKNQIKTVLELDTQVPSLFLIEDQIKQVFMNLFLNATEAMPNGGELIIASFFAPPIIRITITDTGTGIDQMDQDKIFEAFYTTKKQKGTGLGLFVCYKIIQHHGGTLKVNSTSGKGSCFEIILST